MNIGYNNGKNGNRGFLRNAVLLVAAAIGTAYGGVPLYRDGRTDRLGVGGGFVLSAQYQF